MENIKKIAVCYGAGIDSQTVMVALTKDGKLVSSFTEDIDITYLNEDGSTEVVKQNISDIDNAIDITSADGDCYALTDGGRLYKFGGALAGESFIVPEANEAYKISYANNDYYIGLITTNGTVLYTEIVGVNNKDWSILNISNAIECDFFNDIAYVLTKSGKVVAIDTQSGETVETAADNIVSMSAICITPCVGCLFLVDKNGEVYLEKLPLVENNQSEQYELFNYTPENKMKSWKNIASIIGRIGIKKDGTAAYEKKLETYWFVPTEIWSDERSSGVLYKILEKPIINCIDFSFSYQAISKDGGTADGRRRLWVAGKDKNWVNAASFDYTDGDNYSVTVVLDNPTDIYYYKVTREQTGEGKYDTKMNIDVAYFLEFDR